MQYNQSKDTINPNQLKTRDHLMVKVINGVTKAAVHKDRKKHNNKYTSRKKHKLLDE